MSKPKIIGPSGATRYLGHFAGEKVLRDGHNTDGEWKRAEGKRGPVRSDTPGHDDMVYERAVATAKAQLAEKTMKQRSVEPTEYVANEKMLRELKKDHIPPARKPKT